MELTTSGQVNANSPNVVDVIVSSEARDSKQSILLSSDSSVDVTVFALVDKC
ncbi:hypothetical protein [Chengkuizengella sediminis]|uniref:hypothetical protein n=1 Tax=Chengkuizengella sediminis TaxID=1885917 RepID=UPI00138A39AD|nr:hypothetical protein [Chengkuizengella sediminis]NDI34642.1 hypothetical protein [Chengkuizengella sediminis]